MEINTYQKESDAIQFCSLGSGSKGNGTLVAFNETILLIDCGFSTKETVKRLAEKGVLPSQISAILVTHEHSDHIKGVSSFSNKFSIPVWMSKGTSLHSQSIKIDNNNIIDSHKEFLLGSIKITPVLVPHDSREAVQYTFKANNKKLGILTDLGFITNHIVNEYDNCNVLILEFNYDEAMLHQGTYPYKLKQRVSGRFGHLSNEQAVGLLEKMNSSQLQLLVVAHKSAENNSNLIIETLINKMNISKKINYFIATQENGFNWLTIK